MARRAWTQGWPRQFTWARPINVVLQEEQFAVRAEQARQEQAARDKAEDDRDKARQDAIKALAQEGQMLSAGRMNVSAQLASATRMLPAMVKIAETVREYVVNPPVGQVVDAAYIRHVMRIFKDFGSVVRYLVHASQLLIESERQHKGEPSAFIGLEVDGSLTLEEAAREVEELTSLMELARQEGLISDGPSVDLDAEPTRNGNGTGGAQH